MRKDDWISELHYKETLIDNNKNQYFYWEGNKKVMKEEYHIKRGSCCGSGCRHCPYTPQYQKLNKNLREELKTQLIQ